MKRMVPRIDLQTRLFLLLLLTSVWQLAGAQTAEVWPGDANANGTVSHVDLLYLGRWFGETGPARDSISINWTLHEVPKWLPAQPGRPDPAHADCNGDSTVNILDFAAIEVNFGLDNQSNLPDLSSLGTNSTSEAPMSAVLAGGPLTSGTIDTLWLLLGDSLNPVDSLLGFATTLAFDSTLVDTAWAFFDDSWLGASQDLLTIDRYRPGSMDLAATRLDRTDVLQGRGRIGGVVVVMTENLKKAVSITELDLAFAQALGLTSGLQAAPIFANASQEPVYSATEAFEALVYPVPASAALNIAVLAPQSAEISGRLYDSQGRLSRSFRFTGRTALQRAGLHSGVYILELRIDDMVLRKRIIFLE